MMKLTNFLTLCALLLLFSAFRPSNHSISSSLLLFEEYGPAAQQQINPNHFNASFLEALVHDGINQIRNTRGTKHLANHQVLRKAAKEQTNYVRVNGRLDHYQPAKGKMTFKERVNYFGGSFSATGENLQYFGFPAQTLTQGHRQYNHIAYPTYAEAARKIVENWVISGSHYRNLINTKYKFAGTAVSLDKKGKGVYVTQVFGGKCGR